MAALRHPEILTRPVSRALIANGAIVSRHFAQRLLRHHDGGYRPMHVSASTITYVLDNAINTYGDFSAPDDDRKNLADIFCLIMNSEDTDRERLATLTDHLDAVLESSSFYPIPEIVYYADSVDVRNGHFYKSYPYEAVLLLLVTYALPYLTRIVRAGYHLRHENVQRFFSQFCLAASVFRHSSSRASALLTIALQRLIDLRVISPTEDDIHQLIVHDMRQESVHVAGTLGHLRFSFPVKPIFERVVLEIISDPQFMSWEKGFRRLYETMPCPNVMARALLVRFADAAKLVVPPDSEGEKGKMPVLRRRADVDFGFGLTREFAMLVLHELGAKHPATRVVFAKLILGIVAAGGEDYDPYGDKLGERLRLMTDMMDGGLKLSKRHLKWFVFASNGNSLREFLTKVGDKIEIVVDEEDAASVENKESTESEAEAGMLGEKTMHAEFVFSVASDRPLVEQEGGIVVGEVEGSEGTPQQQQQTTSVPASPIYSCTSTISSISVATQTPSPPTTLKTRPLNGVLAEILTEERDRQRYLASKDPSRRGERRRLLVARDASKNPLIEELSVYLAGKNGPTKLTLVEEEEKGKEVVKIGEEDTVVAMPEGMMYSDALTEILAEEEGEAAFIETKGKGKAVEDVPRESAAVVGEKRVEAHALCESDDDGDEDEYFEASEWLVL
ncbi:hypothetical protein BC938DRAFT_480157 [Jimgerdemannia flammicorona]|uniref:Uncharacterized protein n=1 Tax=Jimgerdemannia flammicorona TaxID=994334 RepID=A0A433QXP2_9FUNG|nr:hypothetical protein BC938DRAFT_480157 [Jimgerdemannia flammicorona]